MTTATTSRRRLDAAEVKAAARGRELEILRHAGVPEEILNDPRREHGCPICGGNTRCRLVDAEAGAVRCSHCHATGCGDVLATVMWIRRCSLPEAIEFVADYLGMGMQNGNGRHYPALSPLEAVARAKGVSVESLVAYGAREVNGCVELPAYDADGKQCTTFTMDCLSGASDKMRKGVLAKDKPAGVFLPHSDVTGERRLPQTGEPWIPCEGPKEAAKLYEMGYNAIGHNGRQLSPKHARILAGCDVTLIPNRDKAGAEGVKETTAALWNVAKSIKLAILPAPHSETGGADVRDVCRKPGGEELVHQCIKAARPVNESGEPRPEIARRQLERITAAELATTDYRLEYIIPSVVVDKQPLIIGGPSKAMKTSIMLDMALSMAFGGHFLGRFPVSVQQRVGIISAESGKATLAETCKRISAAAGRNLADLGDRFIVSTTIPRVDRLEDLDLLEEFVKRDRLTVLGLDPVYMMFSDMADRAKNVFAMGEILVPLAERMTALGVTLIANHHSKRTRADGNGRYEPIELEELAFAGWAEFARQWVLIGRRQKFIDGSGEHLLWMRAGGSAGHHGLWGVNINEGTNSAVEGREWRVEVLNASEIRDAEQDKQETRQSDRQQRTRDGHVHKLRDGFHKLGADERAGASEKRIRTLAGVNSENAPAAFHTLQARGEIERCQYVPEGKKTPKDGWRATDKLLGGTEQTPSQDEEDASAVLHMFTEEG